MLRIRGLAWLSVCAVGLVAPRAATAAPISAPDFLVTQTADGLSFGGAFLHDNDYAEILLDISSASLLTVTIDSYLVVDDLPGFDPMLYLLDSSGGQAAGFDADGQPIAVNNQDAGNSPLIARIDPGVYTLVISQYLNFPNLTSPGFSYDDDPLYTCGLYPQANPCTGFVDFDGPHTGDISGSLTIESLEQPAPVPEPGTLALMATGVGWLAARRRRARAPSLPN